MANVIFIRGLSEDEEVILEEYKQRNQVKASTRALLDVLLDYGKLYAKETEYQEKIRKLENKLWEQEQQLKEYKSFFKLFNKLSKSKHNENERN